MLWHEWNSKQLEEMIVAGASTIGMAPRCAGTLAEAGSMAVSALLSGAFPDTTKKVKRSLR